MVDIARTHLFLYRTCTKGYIWKRFLERIFYSHNCLLVSDRVYFVCLWYRVSYNVLIPMIKKFENRSVAEEKICIVCEKVFPISTRVSVEVRKNITCCSKRCHFANQRMGAASFFGNNGVGYMSDDEWNKKHPPKECQHCGINFPRKRFAQNGIWAKQKYCSKICGYAAQKEKIQRIRKKLKAKQKK